MLAQEEHHVIVKAETRGMQQKSRNTKDGTQKPRCLELALLCAFREAWAC